MRIAHATDTLDPAEGGLPACVIRLASAQAALGHDVHIVSYAAPGAEQRMAQSFARVPGVSAVHLHSVPRSGKAERLLAPSARRMLSTVVEGADFVHLHGVWETIIRTAARVARDRSVPCCLCPHGMLDPWSLSQKKLKKTIALHLGYRRMLNAVAFIHALNQDEARLLSPLGLTSAIRIVPNGIFVEEMKPRAAAGSFAARCPPIAGKPFILFMSRLHYKKGLDHLARAFAEVARVRPDVHLVVAGPDGGAKLSFEAAIAHAGLSERVHLVGPLYGAEKLAALSDAACFCLPSRQEGFSLAILEALACGTPVVASQECHFPEVAEAGAGEIVSLSGPALAESLLRVLSHKALAARMGAAGRGLVCREYVWPVIAERLIGAYVNVRAARLWRDDAGMAPSGALPLG